MKLVEMYYALNTVETTEDYDNYIKRYEKELNQINENIIKRQDNVSYIRHTLLELLQDIDIKEVLDQAETLFNDVLRHEEKC
jgi:predicted nuclease with TOPRIM domain